MGDDQKQEWEDHFERLRDKILVKILYFESDQYESGALETVRSVLSQRGIAEERIEEIKREVERELEEETEYIEKAGSSKWVKVRILPSRLYGEQMKDILQQEGIPSLLKGEDVGVFGPGAGYGTSILGVTIWVPEEFRARAEELVEAYLDGL